MYIIKIQNNFKQFYHVLNNEKFWFLSPILAAYIPITDLTQRRRRQKFA